MFLSDDDFIGGLDDIVAWNSVMDATVWRARPMVNGAALALDPSRPAGEYRLGEVFRRSGRGERARIEEGRPMRGHADMSVSIAPQCALWPVAGSGEGTDAIRLAGVHGERGRALAGQRHRGGPS